MLKYLLVALVISGCAPLNHTHEIEIDVDHTHEVKGIEPWAGHTDDPWGWA